ncbi:heterokaryon incompatibility protein-domain-containing protein [Cladorrhinum sp. PSN332]|nr:heterokaryon incompatibility protein-domain-containing protein [Cladorrhinum sp. PSN332]
MDMVADLRHLCHVCQGLVNSIRDGRQNESPGFNAGWQSWSELEKSARTCPFCLAFFTRYERHQTKYHNNPGMALNPDRFFALSLSLIQPQSESLTDKLTFRELSGCSMNGGGVVLKGRVAIIHDIKHAVEGTPFNRSIWSAKQLNLDNRLPTLQNWISECLHSHSACKRPVTMRACWPTRLLDLGVAAQASDATIKVIESKELAEEPKYATLSHCWGSAEMPKTTISTVAKHLEYGFRLSLLPKTFQDAARLARALSIRYLWIDSLCIVQDDPVDWQREASRMGDYYTNSLLTIAATSAKDGREGLFLERENRDLYLGTDTSHGIAAAARVNIATQLDKVNNHSPLTRRGWVLQESILSVRTLHCTDDQWYWKCRGLRESEDGIDKDEAQNSASSFLLPTGIERPRAIYEWMFLARRYSGLQFTYEKDRLPALAGVVDFYRQHRIKDEPVLGGWKSTIACDLGWFSRSLEKPRNNSIPSGSSFNPIPSWSWLSSRRPIKFGYRHLGFEDIRPNLRTNVVEWDIAWSGPAMTSELLSARLVVEGPMLSSSSLPLDIKATGSSLSTIKDPDRTIQFYYDERVATGAAAESTTQEDFLVLSLWDSVIFVDGEPRQFEQQFLILAVMKEEPPLVTCRRVGAGATWFRIKTGQQDLRDVTFFENAPVRRVHLV